VFWSFASFATDVAAQRVVVVHPQSRDNVLLDVYYRLRAELRIHGFEAVAVEWDEQALEPSDAALALAQLAEDHEASAALSLSRRDGQVTLAVWLLDQRRRSSVRSLKAEPSDNASSLLALRAVDLLRMTLQPGAPQPTVAERPPVTPEPVHEELAVQPAEIDETPELDGDAAPELARRPLWLSGAAFLLRTGDRFGFALGPQLGIGYRATPWFEVSLQVAGPILGARLATSGGKASVYQELAWLEVRLFAVRVGGLELAVVFGAGAYFMQASGNVQEPLRARNDQIWSALFTGGAYVGYRLSPRIVLGLELRAVAWAPRVGVAVAEESALVDQPAFAAALGLSFGL
jgi:hypothetical protein